MSHIATALAKSKGKDVRPATGSVTSVPALRVGPVDQPILKPASGTPAAKSAGTAPTAATTPSDAGKATRPKRKGLLGVALLVVVILGAATWYFLGIENPFAAPPPPPTPVAPVKVAPVAPKPERKGPSDALAAQVRLLPVTGAAGGSSQRLSVGGKVYEPGETVVEGLVLQSIENDEIVFRDADGNLYTRRL